MTCLKMPGFCAFPNRGTSTLVTLTSSRNEGGHQNDEVLLVSQGYEREMGGDAMEEVLAPLAQALSPLGFL